MIKSKRLTIVAAVLSLALLGLGIGVALSMNAPNSGQPPQIQGLLWPPAKQLKGFELIDQHGHPFDASRLHGKWTLLYFGYTHCTYICPTTMAALHGFETRLSARGKAAGEQVVFVTVDPQRDTPQQLSTYLAKFDKDFIGLTGKQAQIDVLTKELGILHKKTDQKGPDNYEMAHSASVLLIDPQGRLVGTFGAQDSAPDILRRYLSIRSFVESQA